MSSTDPQAKQGGSSDLSLSFVTVVVFSLLIVFGCAAYTAFGLHETGEIWKKLAAYLLVMLLAGGVTIFLLTGRRKHFGLAYVAAVLLGAEALLGAKIMVKSGHHHMTVAAHNARASMGASEARGQFRFHPVFGISPAPNWRSKSGLALVAGMSHTAEGLRTTVNTAPPGAPEIVVVGGSTAYDIYTSDADTWASKLARKTGLHVDNLAVPAYNSLDHVTQTVTQVQPRRPVCAIYYVGWNDMRNNGQVNIQSDYANYNQRSKYINLFTIPTAFNTVPFTPLENSAVVQEIVNGVRVLAQRRLAAMNDEFFATHAVSKPMSQPDPAPLGYFVRNMTSVIAVNQANGIRTVLIPQVLSRDILQADDARGWIDWVEFTPRHDIPRVMAAYNDALLQLGGKPDVWTIDEVLAAPWKVEHFRDYGHLTPAGAELFAATIAPKVAEICGDRRALARSPGGASLH